MKLIWKRKVAYVLALILGVTGIWGGTAFTLPSMTSDPAEVLAETATPSTLKSIELKADRTTLSQGDVVNLTATIEVDSESILTEANLDYQLSVEDDDDESSDAFTINKSSATVTVTNNVFTVDNITATAKAAGWSGGILFQPIFKNIDVERVRPAWCSLEILGDGKSKDAAFEKDLDKDGTVSSDYGTVTYGVDDSWSSTAIPNMSISMSSSAANAIIKKFMNSDSINNDERAALNNKTAQIYLFVKAMNTSSSSLSPTEPALINSKLSSGHTIGMYLNIIFFVKIGTNASKSFSEPGSDISITVDTSTKFPSIASGKTREYGVVRIHYDSSNNYHTPSAANLSVSNSGQKVTFSSSKFSTYALSYKDTTSSSATSTTTSVSSSRKSSSSDDDDDDDDDSSSKKRGSGSAKGYYTKTSSSTARYDGSALSYKATKATVPATIKLGGKVRNVTSVASYAFFGYEKLTSVTIGKNVKRIGQYAFADCKKLKTVTINSKKLTKKGVKNSLKDSSVTTILVPKDKVKAYKKIFTQKNTGSKGKITVKAKK